ncbi:MAG TPA: TerB family tellurite resistance protein [Dokdonella sp.]|uniref:TerB family tellurite resistance protein n=1 Tax=Dokdonella sp. TaxID=2291710 RepID=UPI0025BE020B|nr:TerB family tellurite resistance protein [Dokdonella sp.]MBX3693149.1 TerB family tellurite resistance protein [Dokdonella sp.]MCW5567478.1 TerB family tellurite resistance protein [Dokdonella sp.]HNR92375.1 TerB family tellurite resistance protein [Dokdonella sp.]
MGSEGLGGVLRDLRGAIGGFFSGGNFDEALRVPVEVSFGLMGWLAKADGVVTSHETDFANRLMDDLGLPERGKAIAHAAFLRGQRREIDINAEVGRFLAVHPKGSPELGRLYDTLLRVVAADDRIFARERTALETLTDAFGFPRALIDARLEAVRSG